MGPLANLPRGLLTLLGIQNLGKYPNALAEIIAPQVSVRDLIEESACERLELSVADGFAGAGGTLPTGTYTFGANGLVPQGERWLFVRWSIACGLLNGGTTSGTPLFITQVPSAVTVPWRRPPALSPYALTDTSIAGTQEMLSGNAAQEYFMIECNAAQFIARPGEQLSYMLTNTPATVAVGGAFTVFLEADIIRLKS